MGDVADSYYYQLLPTGGVVNLYTLSLVCL